MSALIPELLLVTSERTTHCSCLSRVHWFKIPLRASSTFQLGHPRAPSPALRAATPTAHLEVSHGEGAQGCRRRDLHPGKLELPAGTLRLMSGKPCPGAGGLAGLDPLVAFFVAGDAVGDGFRLKGFSLQED